MMKSLTLYVFVSSTFKDLQAERAAVVGALRRLRRHRSVKLKVVIMEEFGSRHESALRTSTNEVSNSHFYVGIIGGRYGTGITEAEYLRARECRMRCLIYFKKVAIKRAEGARLSAFKKRLAKEHVCSKFAKPSELAEAVQHDLKIHLNKYLDKVDGPGGASYTMKEPPSDFVGRRQQIRTLVNALKPRGGVRVAGIYGMSGVGKSALALKVAERLRDTYADARLFIKLGETNDVPFGLHVTLLNCITQLGGKGDVRDDLDTLAGTYRKHLSGRRALIVLDDAVDEAQIAPFMPPAGCALLITSQEKLLAPDTSATLLGLRRFEENEAVALLLRVEPRIARETARRIALLCGHLPLALRAGASLLSATPDLDPDDYVKQLRRERTRLHELGERGVVVGVRASFNLSYERLTEEAKRVFRQLAVFPASFDAAAEREVCADSSGAQLSNLVQRSLVSYDGEARRYQFHDLMRVYAGGRLGSAERAVAARRHAAHFMRVASEIGELLRRQRAAIGKALDKFDLEWENMRAGQAWAASRRASDEALSQCVTYAEALGLPLLLRRHPKEQAAWLKAALAASKRLKLKAKQGRFLCSLGTVYSSTDTRRAIEHSRQALCIARGTGDRVAVANALGSLGNAYVSAARPQKAIDALKQCLSILCAEKDFVGVVHTWNNLGTAYAGLGRPHAAVECFRLAAAGTRKLADPHAESVALNNLGTEYVGLREPEPALQVYERALKLADKTGDRRGQALALNGVGNARAALKEYESALKFHRQALDLSRELGDRRGVCAALCGLGNAQAESEEFDGAFVSHREALKISRKLGDRVSEVLVLGNLGHAYYLSGDYESAINFHQQALRLTRGLNNPAYEATAHWNLGQAYRKKGESGPAERHARFAFEIFARLRHTLAADVREFLRGDMERDL
jgi:tetratricopeptide (TPR) repeat protein